MSKNTKLISKNISLRQRKNYSSVFIDLLKRQFNNIVILLILNWTTVLYNVHELYTVATFFEKDLIKLKHVLVTRQLDCPLKMFRPNFPRKFIEQL